MTGFGFSDGDDTIIKGDDGTIEGQKIGVVGDSLKVSSQLGGIDNNIVPCWGSEYRINSAEPSVNLPAVGSSPYVVESYTGSGKLLGFSTAWDSQRVRIALIVDGTTLFDLDVNPMRNFLASSTTNKIANSFNYNNGDTAFTFEPDEPICFSTSYSIETRSRDNSTNRTLEVWWAASVRES